MRRRKPAVALAAGLVCAVVAVLILLLPSLIADFPGKVESDRTQTILGTREEPHQRLGSSVGVPRSSSRPADLPSVTNATIDYTTANLTLPAWNNLSSYAWNCNSNVSVGVGPNCFSIGGPHLGYAGSQVPLLSWTADGAFYVNASLDLVFYSFVNRTVTRIAPWLPLYDGVMWYTGVTNTEFITGDGSYIYEFGCLETACLKNSSWPITSYAVNVSTGRTFEHQWGGAIHTGILTPGYSSYWNSQMNMVGVAGNDSIMTLTLTWSRGAIGSTNGSIWAYNIWTGAEWKATDLPFFEANNLYWIPEFQEFFDVSAENTQFDAVAQVVLSGPASEPAATLWGPFTYVRPIYGIGGVGGLWVNLSSRQVGFSADWQSHGAEFAVIAQLNATGVVAGFSRVSGPFALGVEPAPTSGEHRSTLVTGGPTMVTSPSKQPTSWLGDPRTNATFWATNVAQDFAAWNVDGSLFYNSSYSILTTSDQCNRVGNRGTDCALEGTAPGTVPGTITWAWQAGLPEFPFLPNAPRAEPNAPGTWNVNASAGLGSVKLAWTPPAAEVDPPINFTLFWGPVGSGETNHVALPAAATSYVIGGLGAGGPISYRLEVWNLHWRTTMSGTGQPRSPAAPPPPTLSVDGVAMGVGSHAGTASVWVTLKEPRTAGRPLTDDTLWWGTAASTPTWSASARSEHLAVGSGTVFWVVDGLSLNSTYYFEGTSWNLSGESLPSVAVPVHTPAGGATGCPSACVAANGSARSLWPILIPALVTLAGALLVTVGSVVSRRREGPRPHRTT